MTEEFSYICYPMTRLVGQERDVVEVGGNIILPPSALHKLTEQLDR